MKTLRIGAIVLQTLIRVVIRLKRIYRAAAIQKQSRRIADIRPHVENHIPRLQCRLNFGDLKETSVPIQAAQLQALRRDIAIRHKRQILSAWNDDFHDAPKLWRYLSTVLYWSS